VSRNTFRWCKPYLGGGGGWHFEILQLNKMSLTVRRKGLKIHSKCKLVYSKSPTPAAMLKEKVKDTQYINTTAANM